MHLSSIYRYPVKSTAGQSLELAEVEPRGLAWDRRWMVVDAQGRFLTARRYARLLSVWANPVADGIELQIDDQKSLHIPHPMTTAPRQRAEVWKSQVDALDAGDEAAHWFSTVLGVSARLVYMDEQARRPVNPEHGHPGDEVSFADGYPLLLISQGSLDGLNDKLERTIPMSRFRPNVVVNGCAPHAEDQWRAIRIGEVLFDVIKPCVRCVLTTVDAQRGERDPSGEPLTTLKTYRRSADGVTFGMNLIPRGRGRIACGDLIQVLATRC